LADVYKPKKRNIINELSPDEALDILKALIREDKDIAGKVEELANELLSDVDPEEIAARVYWRLDNINVEELWHESGKTRYGYVDPGEKAWEMVEEVLEPFLEEFRRYKKLSFNREAKDMCMGIVKGIYRYRKESKSEFKDWAGDAPDECEASVLREWKAGKPTKDDLLELEEFIEQLSLTYSDD